MGLLRNLTVAVGRAVLDTLEKGPPGKPRDDEEQDGSPGEDAPEGQDAPAEGSPEEEARETPEEEAEEVQGQGQVVPPGPGQQAGPAPGPNGPGGTQGAPGSALAVTTPKSPEELEAALSDPKSLFWDPFAVIDALGYKDKPTSITFQTLNAMVWRMPIITVLFTAT